MLSHCTLDQFFQHWKARNSALQQLGGGGIHKNESIIEWHIQCHYFLFWVQSTNIWLKQNFLNFSVLCVCVLEVNQWRAEQCVVSKTGRNKALSPFLVSTAVRARLGIWVLKVNSPVSSCMCRILCVHLWHLLGCK